MLSRIEISRVALFLRKRVYAFVFFSVRVGARWGALWEESVKNALERRGCAHPRRIWLRCASALSNYSRVARVFTRLGSSHDVCERVHLRFSRREGLLTARNTGGERKGRKNSLFVVVVARARRVQTNGWFPKRVNSIHRVLPDAFRAFAVTRYLRTIAVSFLSLREIYARVLISF